MRRNAKAISLAATGLGLAVVLAAARIGAQSGAEHTSAAAAPAPKTAGQAFKNIQVLKDVPADQLVPAMQFIASSLGVECEYCHVQNAFEKDDKKPKQTARKMMQMMFAINKEDFDGHRQVTCYTCHRGAAEPVVTPIIAEEETRPQPPETTGAEGAPAAPPTTAGQADQVVAKYVQALGGADAIHRISSRIEKGQLSGFGDHPLSVDVLAKAPDKRIAVVHLPRGDSITAYDGHTGWLGLTGRPPREMSGGDLVAMRQDADFYFATDIRTLFSDLRVGHPEKVDGREAILLLGANPGQPPVKLYFDEESGLLVRLVRYAETPLGLNPTQIDFGDYRTTDGVKVPFRWTVARPSGRFTIQVDEIQQNAPIDDAKFAEPPAPPPAPMKPSPR